MLSRISALICCTTCLLAEVNGKGAQVRIQQIRSEDDREIVRVDPNPELGGEASVMSRADLNGDGREDLILRFHELCGNWGECPWGVFISLGNRYTTAWGPAYAISLENSGKLRRGWMELNQTVRKGKAKATKRTLRFERGTYRLAPLPTGRGR